MEVVRTHLDKAPAEEPKSAPMAVHPGSKRQGKAEDPAKKRVRTSVGDVNPYDLSRVRSQEDRARDYLFTQVTDSLAGKGGEEPVLRREDCGDALADAAYILRFREPRPPVVLHAVLTKDNVRKFF